MIMRQLAEKNQRQLTAKHAIVEHYPDLYMGMFFVFQLLQF